MCVVERKSNFDKRISNERIEDKLTFFKKKR